MKLRFSLRVLLLAVFTGLLSISCAGTALVDVPLRWKPTSSIQNFNVQPINLTRLRGDHILIVPFTNNSSDKTLIGENRKGEIAKPVRTNSDVAAFVTEHTRGILVDLGYPITDKPDQATLSLSGKILNFTVVERGTYVGDTRIKLTIHKNNEVVWEGLALGRATRFGRSYELENYYEVLADSLLEAMVRTVTSQAFQDGITSTAMVVPQSK